MSTVFDEATEERGLCKQCDQNVCNTAIPLRCESYLGESIAENAMNLAGAEWHATAKMICTVWLFAAVVNLRKDQG